MVQIQAFVTLNHALQVATVIVELHFAKVIVHFVPHAQSIQE
jgi:hypothetical protein